MIDITYCTFSKICKQGYKCDKAFTQDVYDKHRAEQGVDNPVVEVYEEFPECFIAFFMGMDI